MVFRSRTWKKSRLFSKPVLLFASIIVTAFINLFFGPYWARSATSLLDKFGLEKARWSLGLVGFLVAIPVFFDVGLVILAPAVYGLAKRAKKPTIYFALPLLAGLAATHAFIPPTPGPIAVAGILEADLGWVIGFGALTAVPAVILAGPIYGGFISKRIGGIIPSNDTINNDSTFTKATSTPPAGQWLVLMALPLFLILLGSVAKTWTVSTTIIAVTGLVVTSVISLFV